MVVVLGQLAYPEKMEIDKAKANLNVSPPIYNSDTLVMCVCVSVSNIFLAVMRDAENHLTLVENRKNRLSSKKSL